MSDVSIPLAGVIGDPIAHSRSPRMHKHWLQRYRLAGDYVPLHVRSDDLEDVLRALPKMGFVGANVTIPHKQAVLKLADDVSETAKAIGAANTLVFAPNGRILADNTDAYGFAQNIRQQVPDWQPQAGPAIVLGAGGAARAVLFALREAGVPQIWLANRTLRTAEDLAEAFGSGITPIAWSDLPTYLPDAAFLVNTTSLGMIGQPELALPFDALSPQTLVSDIVYAPLETGLLAAARSAGCRTADGIGMLMHQGVPGFERWFGHRPEVDVTLRDIVLA